MIEAEVKARLADPGQIRERLEELCTGASETYHDTYFDTPGSALAVRDRELRVRTITCDGDARHLLTFKDSPVDAATRSKPEIEMLVSDPHAAAAVLTALGYPAQLAFTKQCVNYPLDRRGRRFLATLVTVPEIDGTFLELETQAAPEEVDAALNAVRAVLFDLGVGQAQWTTDTYTDSVRASRGMATGTPKPG